MSIPLVAVSSGTYPIRNVQLGSGLNLTEPRLRVTSGSQDEPLHHRRADKEAPREPGVLAPTRKSGVPGIPLPTGALASLGHSREHLCRSVAVSLHHSACPASSSTVVGVVGEQDDLKRRMDEYMLQKNYQKSIRGEDSEELIEAPGSPLQTDMASYYYSGPQTDLAATASLPKRASGTPWPTLSAPPCKCPTLRPELPKTTRAPEATPA